MNYSAEQPALTSSQQAAFDTLHRFALGETDTSLAVLSGWAGTGKTFLIARLLAALAAQLFIAVAAPTNKAVRVLREKLAESGVPMADEPDEPGLQSVPTGRIAFGSIHAFLGLQLNEREDGTQECKSMREPKLHLYDLVVVDECSMIGDELFQHIALSKRDARILFVGDSAQLPPIQAQEGISPCFQQVQLQVVLSEVVRQAADNPIIALSIAIRHAIEQGRRIEAIGIASVLPPLPAKAALVPGNADTIVAFTLWELQEGRDARVVAFTNQQVQHFNARIHEALHGATEYPFVPGERVIVHQQTSGALVGKDGTLSVGRATLITSEEAEVISLERREHPFYPNVPAVWVVLARDDGTYAGVYLALSQAEIERAVAAEFAEWRRLKSAAGLMVQAGRHKEADEAREAAKKSSNKAWALRRAFAPLRHAYAMTAHKSQGSTFDSAIVDLNDLAKMKSAFQFNRALYVAATRAREHLAIVA